MEFNPSKCQVIRNSNKGQPIPSTYTIHGHVLEVVDSAKYLGVYLDSKINSHIDAIAITKKARRCPSLCRNLSRTTRNIKATSYKTYTQPIMEYAFVCWDTHTQKNITFKGVGPGMLQETMPALAASHPC